MLAALATFVVVAILGALEGSASMPPFEPAPRPGWAYWGSLALRAATFAALVVVTSQVSGGGEGWPAAVFACGAVLATTLLARTSWQRFYASLDVVCLGVDDGPGRSLLLLDAPAGRGAEQVRRQVRAEIAARRAHALDRSDRAFVWATALPPRATTQAARARRSVQYATYALAAGWRERAREALAGAPDVPVDPEVDAAREALKAVLDVLDGVATSELRTRAETEWQGAPPNAAGWAAAAAHLRAAEGDPEGAKLRLERVRAANGRTGLLRVARQGGPASPIAAELSEAAAS